MPLHPFQSVRGTMQRFDTTRTKIILILNSFSSLSSLIILTLRAVAISLPSRFWYFPPSERVPLSGKKWVGDLTNWSMWNGREFFHLGIWTDELARHNVNWGVFSAGDFNPYQLVRDTISQASSLTYDNIQYTRVFHTILKKVSLNHLCIADLSGKCSFYMEGITSA